MTATLKMTHKAIGIEVRRGTYDIVVDGQRAGSLEMNDTIESKHSVGVLSGTCWWHGVMTDRADVRRCWWRVGFGQAGAAWSGGIQGSPMIA